MNVRKKADSGMTIPSDSLARRLRLAIVVSVLLNIIAWRAVAAMAKRPMYIAPRPVEITRVIIDKKGHKIEKKITKEQIKQHVVKVRKPPPQRLKQVVFRQPQPPKPTEPPQLNKVLTATDKGPGNGEPEVAAGGDSKVGAPVVQQPDPTRPPMPEVKSASPPVVKTPEPIKPAPAPAPPVVKAPDPPPVIKQPDPPPVPVNKGPTKDAEPSNEIKPEIPDSLRHGDFKSFVRVKVEIDEDGNATTILRTSSGNPDIDQRVLDALKKWKWKPALQNGEPVKSVQLFKFEFLVE